MSAVLVLLGAAAVLLGLDSVLSFLTGIPPLGDAIPTAVLVCWDISADFGVCQYAGTPLGGLVLAAGVAAIWLGLRLRTKSHPKD